MVCTKADMIVNHINHHHIIHHQGIIYNSLNFLNFFYEKESPIYQYNDYEEDRMAYGRHRGFANPNLHRRGEFPNPNRRNKFLNFIRDQRGGYSNLDKSSTSIPTFDGSHDVESTLLWIEKVHNLFDMKYIRMEDLSSLWLINLKEGQRHGGIDFKTCVCTKASHL